MLFSAGSDGSNELAGLPPFSSPKRPNVSDFSFAAQVDFEDRLLLTSTPARKATLEAESKPDVFLFPEYPPDDSISHLSHARTDKIGRLVRHASKGKLNIKRPDFVLYRKERAYLVIEDKLQKRTEGVRQLFKYMDDLGQDENTIGMVFRHSTDQGIMVTILKRSKVGQPLENLDGKSCRRIEDPDECHWFQATDPFVHKILSGIVHYAVHDDPSALELVQ